METTEFADVWPVEDEALAAARSRAEEVGLRCASPGAGAMLRWLAAIGPARAVVELGTGTGVSGLWLLRGMPTDGSLTTIDTESEHLRLAKASFADAGVPTGRVRLIAGQALDVMSRLTPNAYDLVHIDANPAEAPEVFELSLGLLRPGGLIVVSGALRGGRVGDSAARDAETVAARDLLRQVAADPRVSPVVLPLGEGMLVAALPRGEGASPAPAA